MLNRNQESGVIFSNANIKFDPKYIHTMKDDLSPAANAMEKPVKPTSNSSFFSEKKEAKQESPVASSSPFLSSSAPTNIDVSEQKPLATTQAPIPTIQKNTPPLETKKSSDAEKKSSFSLGKFLIIFISLLIISILFLGGYYFWMIRETKTNQTTETPLENAAQEPEQQITITPASEKYSFDKPNYLSINIETDDSEKIKSIVTETAKEIKETTTKTPFEFVITDSNNNPLAFPIFATASNLSLSSELISSLEEAFSFYIYNDEGNTRTGLVIEIKSESAMDEKLKASEVSLVNALSFLFLDKSPEIENAASVFNDSLFGEIPVRFINLDSQKSLSIDYAVFENKLIIGTSKNTMQAILNKLVQEKGILVE
ncbi:MAG: hypothetical protein ACD_11C00116G0027 [uncultured bacterium]|nr:MAG: hypothetical protein ACD_11C00116G0027 [uncultured bacterium]HBR71228.1 hypothetical protein [Candidatus Moranbacteria bacterium]